MMSTIVFSIPLPSSSSRADESATPTVNEPDLVGRGVAETMGTSGPSEGRGVAVRRPCLPLEGSDWTGTILVGTSLADAADVGVSWGAKDTTDEKTGRTRLDSAITDGNGAVKPVSLASPTDADVVKLVGVPF